MNYLVPVVPNSPQSGEKGLQISHGAKILAVVIRNNNRQPLLNGNIAEIRRMDCQGGTMPTCSRERTEEKEMSGGFLMLIAEWTGGINRNSSLLKVRKGGNTVM